MSESKYGKLGARIIESLEEAIRHARGEDTGARVTYGTAPVTARKAHLEMPPYYPPHLVRDIRQKLAVSQAIFAQMLGVSVSTVRAWEQGKREAEGPVGRLLQIAEMYPDVLKDVCGEMIPATPGAPRTPRAVRAPAAGGERLAADSDAQGRGKPERLKPPLELP